MKFQFEEFDFCGENAARTARIMRAIADAADPSPQAVVVSTEAAAGLKEYLAKHSGPAFADCGPMTPQPLTSGTVATHVSAAAVGDVPFADVAQQAATTVLGDAPLDLPKLAEVAGDLPCGAPVAPAGGLDAEGYPWDERIHSSSRNTVADGTWRRKRGVDDALVAEVRAEWDAKLRSAAPAPAPTEATRYWHHPESSCVFKTEPGEPIGTDGCVEEVDEATYLQLEREYASQRAPAAPTEAERLQADHVATMPVDPATVGFGAAPALVPPPPPVAPATGDTWPDEILGPRTDAMAPFPQFMAWAGKRMSAGQLDNPRLLAVLNEHGVTLLPMLSAPEHVGKIPAIARQLAEE